MNTANGPNLLVGEVCSDLKVVTKITKETTNMFRTLAAVLLALITFAGQAHAAKLTLSSLDKGGSIITEDGNLQVKRGTKSRKYNGFVVIHSNPWRGWRLRGWAGDCKGRAPICRVKMNRNRKVVATWERIHDDTPSVYDNNGIKIGRIVGHDVDDAVNHITVLTKEGYTVNIDRHSGTLGRYPGFAQYDGPNCSGNAWVSGNVPPGHIGITQENDNVVYVPKDAQPQGTVTVYSLYIFGECEPATGPYLIGPPAYMLVVDDLSGTGARPGYRGPLRIE